MFFKVYGFVAILSLIAFFFSNYAVVFSLCLLSVSFLYVCTVLRCVCVFVLAL